MPVLQIELTDEQFQTLERQAKLAKRSELDLAQDHVREWLDGHRSRFQKALSEVLQENEELYRRLA